MSTSVALRIAPHGVPVAEVLVMEVVAVDVVLLGLALRWRFSMLWGSETLLLVALLLLMLLTLPLRQEATLGFVRSLINASRIMRPRKYSCFPYTHITHIYKSANYSSAYVMYVTSHTVLNSIGIYLCLLACEFVTTLLPAYDPPSQYFTYITLWLCNRLLIV